MTKHKKLIALITILFVSVAAFSICPTTVAEMTTEGIDETEVVTPVTGDAAVAAAAAYSETYTYATIDVTSTPVLAAPVWTSDAIETLYQGHGFNIIYREYDYYYIQYAATNGVVRRGYILRSATNETVGTWGQYTIYRAGYNKTNASQPVYYTYYSGSAQSGTIYANEGNTTDSTIIVLCGYNNRYLIQYITNISTAGAEHIKWKRGWVDPSVITLKTVSSVSSIDNKTKFYLQNVATGRYLNVPGNNAVDGANMEIWDFHGGDNQEWELTPRTDNGATYVTISTCQSNTSSTGLVLAVKDALAVKNTRLDLAIKGSPPSKDQEFNIVEAPGYPGEYIIYSRLTGEFLQMGVFQDDTGNGGIVAARYPYVTWYNRWKLIPVYTEGVDYEYLHGKDNYGNDLECIVHLPSSAENGVAVSYDISGVTIIDNNNQFGQYNFLQYTSNALTTWSTGNRLFTLTNNALSTNTFDIIFGEYGYYGLTESNYYISSGEIFESTITLSFDRIQNEVNMNNVSFSNVWQSVVAHELGHTLGLKDIDDQNHPRAYTSLMSYDRDRNTVIGPSNSDVAAVKKLYMNGGN